MSKHGVNIATYVLNPDGTTTPTSFRVDIDKLPHLLAGIKAALDTLETAKQTARHLQDISPPASDPVSVQSTPQFGALAGDGAGQLMAALHEGIAVYTSIKDQCEQVQRRYSTTDTKIAKGIRLS